MAQNIMDDSIICQINKISNESSTFNLLFRSKYYQIPSNFNNFSDINPDIYKQLLETKEYVVKSDVETTVFESFIDYWIARKVPNIAISNLPQYQLLSDEFDIMQNLIQIYQEKVLSNADISLLVKQQDQIKKNMEDIKKQYKTAKDKYQSIIKILFTNDGIKTHERFNEVKNALESACEEGYLYIVNFLTQIQVEEDGLTYVINEKDKTAGVCGSSRERSDFFIPKSVKYQNQDFLVTSILDKAFNCNRDVKTVEFAKDSELRNIENCAFFYSSIEKIVIPPHVVKIGRSAFSNCSELRSIEFAGNSELKSIEYSGIHYSPIKKLTIPSSVERISQFSLASLEELTDITVVDQDVKNITYFDNKFLLGKTDPKSDIFDVLIFARRDIENVEIPDFVKIIAPSAFEKCNKLKTVTFSKLSKLVSIGEKAFNESSLESISIPSSVRRIDDSAFYYCKNLTRVDIPSDSQMNSIGRYSFSICMFENFTIPSKIVCIGEGAFNECTKLKTVNIPDDSDLRFIGEFSFCSTNIKKFSIPSKVENFLSTSFAGSNELVELNVRNGNKNFIYYDNSMIIGKSAPFGREFDKLLFVRSDSFRIHIPSYVKEIDRLVLLSCKNLKYVEFDYKSGLKTIQMGSFQNSHFEKVSLPPSIERIEYESFRECEKLAVVDFHPHSQLKVIEKNAFKYSALLSVSIPVHVESIGIGAFASTSIIIVEFQDESEIKSIDITSFDGCPIEMILMPSRLSEFMQNFRVYHVMEIGSSDDDGMPDDIFGF